MKPGSSALPTVSVIVPVRNEGDNVGALVRDLTRQERAPAEILIVDTGSTDDTCARVTEEAQQDPRVRLLRAPGALPGGGRNAGIRATASDWVAFIDGGMRIDSRWLGHLMAAADRGEPVDVVLGGLEPTMNSRLARAAALAYVPERRAAPTGGEWRGFCLPSSAVRRQLAIDVGGFPESLRSAEDLVFLERLQSQGRFAWAPDAKVRWTHANSPGDVWRRFRTYAEHSFRGGFMKDWFVPVARRYSIVAAASGPALPAAVVMMLLARSWVMQRRKPEFTDPDLGGRLLQLVEVAFLLGTIDLAMFSAWAVWLSQGRPRAVLDSLSSPSAPGASV
jgi:glycosyltransferase involved in cell wall biosynthesis